MESDKIFNSSVAAHAIAAADQIGLFNAFQNDDKVDKNHFFKNFENKKSLQIVIDILVELKIVKVEGNWLIIAENFEEYHRRSSLFSWLFHASANVLCAAPELMKSTKVIAPRRNSPLIGDTMGRLGQVEIDNKLQNLAIWSEINCVLDIGCGDGSRLRNICHRFEMDGVGVDVNLSPLWTNISRSSLDKTSRIKFHQGDICKIGDQTIDQENIDCIFMALMGHDLLPAEKFGKIFSEWISKFPSLRYFVFCETYSLDEVCKDFSAPVPCLGYEYLHSLMNVPIASYREWTKILLEAGLVIHDVIDIDIPGNTSIWICEIEDRNGKHLT